VDGDGHLDLIIGNYFADGAHILDAHATEGDTMQHSMSRALNGAEPRVLIWTGATRGAHPSVSYRDATNEGVPGDARHGWTLAVGAADLSGKLLPNLYLANDFGPDRPLDNRSTPGHPELRLEPADKPAPSRGIAIADAFGDGRLDFAVANQWGDTVFYRNLSPAPHRFLGLSLRLPIAEQDGLPTQESRLNAEPPSRPAIGAEATVTLPDGRRRTAQVDGGNGHSGKRAPELHFGLGDAPADAAIPVDLKWRDAGGVVRQARLTLSPGWHTIMLGVDPGGSRDANPGG
jgi:hypothetical protein